MNSYKQNIPPHWIEEYEFYGLFYLIGDHSKFGHNARKQLTQTERTEREVKLIINHLKPQIGDSILDCPCGYGRHSIELAKKGFKITGIDINKYFINFCNNEKAKFNLTNYPEFVLKNMLQLDLSSSNFNFAINMFTSFGFFDDEDNERVIQIFFDSLLPGGKLLLHFDYNATRIENGTYFNGDEHKYRDCEYNGKMFRLWIEEEYDEKTKRLNGSWEIKNGNPFLEKKYYFLRIYSNDEIFDLLKKKGFSDVVFIDPDKNVFDDESTETVIIATK